MTFSQRKRKCSGTLRCCVSTNSHQVEQRWRRHFRSAQCWFFNRQQPELWPSDHNHISTTWSTKRHHLTDQLLCLYFDSLNAELNPICHLLALLGAHHILHVSRIRVKWHTNHIIVNSVRYFILTPSSTVYSSGLVHTYYMLHAKPTSLY